MPAWLPILMGAGTVLGGAAKGRAEERKNANDFIQRENDRQSRDYGTEQQALLQLLGLSEAATRDRADRALLSPKERARQSLLGSLMQSYQPLSVSGLPASVTARMPKTTGGFGALNAGAREGGALLQSQALDAMRSGSDVPALPDMAAGKAAKPTYQGYQKGGTLEGLLSLAGLGGALAGVFKK